MARFYYRVWVDVPDEALSFPEGSEFNECYDWYAEDFTEGEGPMTYSPESMALIVMGERLGCDEDYGFPYTVDWEAL